VKAPVDTAIDFALKDPGFGTGLYDREGGLKVGETKVYDVVGPEADSFALQMQLRSAGLSIDGAEIGRRLKALEAISQRDFHMEVLQGFSYE
ncbi:hypothetical protein, partial [Streptomyces sp. NRRL S-1896]|uniref:hypothetical protein n=1 Tax=Streptomyces sp. NRRL S-1896 TaxID=1463893 RepID=UPI00131AD9D5